MVWAFLIKALSYFNPLPAVTRGFTYGYVFDMPQNPQDIELAAWGKASAEIRSSEGYRKDVYYDKLNILTVGIGHKVKAADKLKFGDVITDKRIAQFWHDDFQGAFTAAKAQALELGKYNADMIAALASVNFQLGTGWRSKFNNTWVSLKAGNSADAIARIKSSLWIKQTENRAENFIAAIKRNYYS